MDLQSKECGVLRLLKEAGRFLENHFMSQATDLYTFSSESVPEQPTH